MLSPWIQCCGAKILTRWTWAVHDATMLLTDVRIATNPGAKNFRANPAAKFSLQQAVFNFEGLVNMRLPGSTNLRNLYAIICLGNKIRIRCFDQLKQPTNFMKRGISEYSCFDFIATFCEERVTLFCQCQSMQKWFQSRRVCSWYVVTAFGCAKNTFIDQVAYKVLVLVFIIIGGKTHVFHIVVQVHILIGILHGKEG